MIFRYFSETIKVILLYFTTNSSLWVVWFSESEKH